MYIVNWTAYDAEEVKQQLQAYDLHSEIAPATQHGGCPASLSLGPEVSRKVHAWTQWRRVLERSGLNDSICSHILTLPRFFFTNMGSPLFLDPTQSIPPQDPNFHLISADALLNESVDLSALRFGSRLTYLWEFRFNKRAALYLIEHYPPYINCVHFHLLDSFISRACHHGLHCVLNEWNVERHSLKERPR